MTRMPGKHRISAAQAMLFIGSIRERLSSSRSTGTNMPCTGTSAALRNRRRSIYDAMLAIVPSKAKAETIYSWKVGTMGSAEMKSLGVYEHPEVSDIPSAFRPSELP